MGNSVTSRIIGMMNVVQKTMSLERILDEIVTTFLLNTCRASTDK